MPDIRFDSHSGSYWIGDKKLRSVSSLVAIVEPPFDRERISLFCAKRDGVPQEEILRQWEEKRERSVARGELVHSYIDSTLGGRRLFAIEPDLPECRGFFTAWSKLQENCYAKVVSREQIVFSESLGVAGRFDLLLSVNEGEFRLLDWKTGKYRTENRFENMLPPFDDLPACEHTKASLQTSIYRLLYERSDSPLPLDDSYVVNLCADGSYVVYFAMDLRERASAWLEELTRA